MTARPILTAPDPRLQAVSTDVEKVDAEIRKLVDDMAESMYAADGIGLAAVQIGVPKRVIVIDLDQREKEAKNPVAYINPQIVWASEEVAVFEEGCLSVPEIWDDVERPARIKAEYLDRDGNKQVLEADGLLATCLQHEMDHLNGVLFIDHLSRLKRSMAIKKLTKAKKLKRRPDAWRCGWHSWAPRISRCPPLPNCWLRVMRSWPSIPSRHAPRAAAWRWSRHPFSTSRRKPVCRCAIRCP